MQHGFDQVFPLPEEIKQDGYNVRDYQKDEQELANF
jgi:hypothetical protein